MLLRCTGRGLPRSSNTAEGPLLITQGNLLNRHSHKYSGLANSKVVSIHPSADGSQIVIAKIKADAKPNQASFVGFCVVWCVVVWCVSEWFGVGRDAKTGWESSLEVLEGGQG